MFLFFKTKTNEPVPDAEIDIENLPIASIERREDVTVIEFLPLNTDWREIACTTARHNEFVRRFRKKLGLPEST